MVNILSEPYPRPVAATQRWRVAAGISAGVFIVLYFLRPFGLSQLPGNVVLSIAAGYGLITLLTILFNEFVFPATFPSFFDEKQWTVGKHLLFTGWNFVTVGLVNFLYSHYLGFIRFHPKGLLYFQVLTLLVGVFPVSIVILFRYAYLIRLNLRSASTLQEALEHRPPLNPAVLNSLIDLPSENKGERLRVSLDSLLYMTAADNYVEVVYRDGNETRKKLVRNTLSRMEILSRQHPTLYRCHRTHLVNLSKVKGLAGNSQGCMLILEDTHDRIPVSRSQYRPLLAKLKS